MNYTLYTTPKSKAKHLAPLRPPSTLPTSSYVSSSSYLCRRLSSSSIFTSSTILTDLRSFTSTPITSSMTLKPLARPLAPYTSYLSPTYFSTAFLQPQRPGHFPSLVSPSGPRPAGAASNPHTWPAVKRWGADDGRGALQGIKNEETEGLMVPVEIGRRGRGYMDGETASPEDPTISSRDGALRGWEKLHMPFGLFLDAFVARTIPWSSGEMERDVVGYMAQYDLLSAAPRTLAMDCPSLAHTTAGPKGDREQWRSNVWIGPEGGHRANSFTPIHRDPYENVSGQQLLQLLLLRSEIEVIADSRVYIHPRLSTQLFVQIVGTKRLHLFPPDLAPLLSLARGTQNNTSLLQTEEVLLDGGSGGGGHETLSGRQADDVRKALANEHTWSITIKAGDAVYIPSGWYHCVRALSVSASVNYWFR